MKLLHWLLIGALLHLVHQRRVARLPTRPAPSAVPNLITHPIRASISITMLVCNGPFCRYTAIG